jgi:isocitrate/isopropylmalate dehydrogenase
MKLAVIAGDGIGPEVVGEAIKILDIVLPGVEKTEYDLGARRYHATGELLTEATIEELRGYDAILFGDIITDLASAVCGGIGLAASGNIDATLTNPSMFEPVHGSAPDIAGQGIADPTAAIMSVSLLLAHLAEFEAAARVDGAVAEHLATRGDESLSTAQVGERILGKL